MLNVLDLFSGIGGFSLGLERTGGFKTVAFCEQDKFCQQVLAKHWPGVPIFDDIRTLKADAIGPVDIITGGFPCQPFSNAGERRGTEDDRYLWPEMLRIIDEFRPAWVIGENVAGLTSMVFGRSESVVESRIGGRTQDGIDYTSISIRQEDMLFGRICDEISEIGYAVQPFIIPACAVDASHRRDRVWIVANAERLRRRKSTQSIDSERQSLCPPKRKESPFGIGSSGASLANATGKGQPNNKGGGAFGERTGGRATDNEGCGVGTGERWLPEPDVGRVANGIPRRVDRLRSLGNAVVPQIPEMIGHAILQAESTMA